MWKAAGIATYAAPSRRKSPSSSAAMIDVSTAGASRAARIPQSGTGIILERSSFREISSPAARGKPEARSGQRMLTGCGTRSRRDSMSNASRPRRNPKMACSAPTCCAQVVNARTISSFRREGSPNANLVSHPLMNGARESSFDKRSGSGRAIRRVPPCQKPPIFPIPSVPLADAPATNTEHEDGARDERTADTRLSCSPLEVAPPEPRVLGDIAHAIYSSAPATVHAARRLPSA